MSAKEIREALENLADDGTLARHDRRDGSFVITVKGPLGENLGQNAHVHWRVKARATKTAREVWGDAALAVSFGGEPFHRKNLPKPMAAVRLTFHAYFCRKGTKTQTEEWIKATGYRPRDLDNLVAAMKPAIDGLVDAGLVQDDDKTRVRYGDHDIAWVEAYEQERVEILVAPLEQGGVG